MKIYNRVIHNHIKFVVIPIIGTNEQITRKFKKSMIDKLEPVRVGINCQDDNYSNGKKYLGTDFPAQVSK